MRNLISAGFSRLFTSKRFYFTVFAVLAMAAWIMLDAGHSAQTDSSAFNRYMEQSYFDAGPASGAFISAFLALFIGTDYSDGVLRNRLAVGRTRTEVYLANAVLCAAASLVLNAAWLVGGLAGAPFLDGWTIGADGILLALAVSALAAVSLSALLLLAVTLCGNKAGGAVTCIFLWLALLVTASSIYNRLCEPEMASGIMVSMGTGIQIMPPTPNPAYISGPLRTVLTAVVNILPLGQMILLANIASREGIANYPLQFLSSLLLTVCATGAGLFLFQRKDLK